MIELLREVWPVFGVIGVIVVPLMLAEVLDYFLPGYGYMTLAYLICLSSVSFVAWQFWKGM